MAGPRAENVGFRRRPKILDYLGTGGAEESEAREHARDVVRAAREAGSRFPEGPAPGPDEVRERREARQQGRHVP